MKQKIKKILFKKFFILLLFSGSCLEELIVDKEVQEASISAKILHYIESNGDHLNSSQFPALINAEDLFNNSTNFTIIDVRSSEEFSRGHIPEAVNVSNNNLFDFIIERRNEQIVLVSASGQSAAYFTALMRSYGVENIFALKFGMASWNLDFADVWLDALRNLVINNFTNLLYEKEELQELPIINESYEGLSTQEIVERRIRDLILVGFTEELSNEDASFFTRNTIAYDAIAEAYDAIEGEQSKYMICFGNGGLYYSGRQGDLGNPGHPVGTTWYNSDPPPQLKSINFLQTLPTDKTIIIYSFGGHTSAMATAHLGLLGYNVRSVLFGAHNIFYNRLVSTLSFTNLIFTNNSLNNFDYIKD